jgi:hypothetical protein
LLSVTTYDSVGGTKRDAAFRQVFSSGEALKKDSAVKKLGLLGSLGLLSVLYSNVASAQELAPAPPPAADPATAPSAAPIDSVQAAAPGKLLSTGPTAWAGLGYFGLYGIGVSYMLPVAHGVLRHPTIRDQFVLEFGADYHRRSYGWSGASDYTWNEIVPMGGVAWMVWLKSNLAVYPKLDVGYAFGWLSGFDCGPTRCSDPSYGGIFVDGSVGVLYDIGSVVLRGEAGNQLVKGGIAFLF